MKSLLTVVVLLLSLQVFAQNGPEILITPSDPTINVGDTIQLDAARVVKTGDGKTVDSGLDKDVSWSSSDPDIATVNRNGVVTGFASGTVEICAHIEQAPFDVCTKVTVKSGNFFVYVVNVGSTTLSGFSNLPGGSLSPLSGFPVEVGCCPISIAADPTGKLAYVGGVGGVDFNQVFGYQIDPISGAFTPVPGSPPTAGTTPASQLVDPAGAHLYVGNFYSNNISVFQIGTNGMLTEIAGSPFATGKFLWDIAMDRQGKFLYATNIGGNTLSAFTVNADGSLTPIAGSPYPTPTEPAGITVDPLNRFVFVTSVGIGGEAISTFQMNSATGALTSGPVLPLTPNTRAYAIAVDPTGKFAYVANEGTSNIGGYSINASTGALQALPGSPFGGGGVQGPVTIAMDKSGHFVYLPNPFQDTVSGFAIDGNTGALTPVPGSPFPVGKDPFSVTVVPRP